MFAAVQDGLEYLTLSGQDDLREEFAAKVVAIEEDYMHAREEVAIYHQNQMHAAFIWVSEESYKRTKSKNNKAKSSD
jgi:hypothetical protein